MSQEADQVDLHGPARARKDQRAKRRKVTEENDEADLIKLAGTDWGRRIVSRLWEEAKVFQSEFTANALQEAFMKGRRDFALWMLQVITEACPDKFSLILKERADVRDSSADASRKPN